jgi:hypothetical protein
VNAAHIDKTDYGTNYIGTPYMTEGHSWCRDDRYVGQDGKGEYERRFAAGKDDRSPMARPMYAGKGNCSYHPRCSCCWLGFSHTLAVHQREAVGDWNV